MPDAAITTDIIVGFPGETEDDFAATLDVVRQARFASAFTFQYSPRPGTPAATMADQVPPEVVTERYHGWSRPSRTRPRWRATATRSARRSRCWSRRARAERTAPPTGCADGPATAGWCTSPPTGPAVDGRCSPRRRRRPPVTHAAPHHLVADGDLITHRRTNAGDRHADGQIPRTPGVGLGMPTFGRTRA